VARRNGLAKAVKGGVDLGGGERFRERHEVRL